MFNKLLFGFVGLAVLLFTTSCNNDDDGPVQPKGPDYTVDQSEIGTDIGQTGPDFTLKDIEGNDVTLKDYRGKAVLLYFWRTNCGTCKTYMPTIKTLWDTYKSQGLVVIGISLDTYESNWTDYLSGYEYDWVQLIDDKANWSNSVVYPYCEPFTYIPFSYILDRYGRVIESEFPGYLDLDQLIQDALAEE